MLFWFRSPLVIGLFFGWDATEGLSDKFIAQRPREPGCGVVARSTSRSWRGNSIVAQVFAFALEGVNIGWKSRVQNCGGNLRGENCVERLENWGRIAWGIVWRITRGIAVGIARGIAVGISPLIDTWQFDFDKKFVLAWIIFKDANPPGIIPSALVVLINF